MGRMIGSTRARRLPNVLYENLPAYGVAGVYILYRNDEVVYVGQSRQVRTRLLSHVRRFHVDTFQLTPIADKRERMQAERMLIAQYRPIENRVFPVTDAAPYAL